LVEAALDAYRSGRFNAAVDQFSAEDDAEAFRAGFIKGAAAWVSASPADAAARRFVAAALALEVAQARLTHDNLSTIVLLDWATRQLRAAPASPAERSWTLAAVALVERGGRTGYDFPQDVSSRWGEDFIEDAVKRFPGEQRLLLARAVFDWRMFSAPSRRARSEFEKLAVDPVVGAEALLQLAYLELEDRDYQTTTQLARRAADQAREPAVAYLAHFIMAFCHEAQGRPADAVASYTAALQAVPYGQSASIALAALLMRDNQADAAFHLIDHSLAKRPDGDDPWRLFVYGGYVRWPLLIADVRKEIR
jgi:hypothetical protein